MYLRNMPKKHIYEQLLEQGVPKETLDKLVHFIILEQIKNKKLTHQTKNTSPKIFFQFKPFHLLKHLSGKALCLLKTQFIKKPKNPV